MNYVLFRQMRIPPECHRRRARNHTPHHPRAEPACRHARATAKVEKISRPTVDEGISLEDWLYFEQRWREYKDATRVAGSDLTNQLLDCCNPEGLRKNLVRVRPLPLALSATALPAYISIKHHFTFTNKIHIEMFNKFIIMITLQN